jgi:hypothetical protein
MKNITIQESEMVIMPSSFEGYGDYSSVLGKRKASDDGDAKLGALYAPVLGMSCRQLLCRAAQSNKRRRKNKTVTFSEDENKIHVRHLDEEDLKNAWMQPRDFDSIRRNNRRIIHGVRDALARKQDIAKYFDLRGLEEHILVYVYGREAMRNRRVTRRIVQEQNAQKSLGKDDPMLLRMFSTTLSRDAIDKALVLASIDEKYCQAC